MTTECSAENGTLYHHLQSSETSTEEGTNVMYESEDRAWYCGELSSMHDRAIVLLNSQKLWFHAQDRHKIGASENVQVVNGCWSWGRDSSVVLCLILAWPQGLDLTRVAGEWRKHKHTETDRQTKTLGLGGMGSLVEKPQDSGSSECLLYAVE